jgi:FecR-like protein
MFRAAVVVMQFMISAQAGLVNYVDGPVNVQLYQQLAAGTPIQTGPQGHVEILLNPGSFLRLGENSTIVLDSVQLTHIAVRVVSGAASIESTEIDKRTPIRVTTGNLQTLIVSSGSYRFSDDTASVIDGKLRTAESAITVKKGQQVTAIDNRYEKRKTAPSIDTAELDQWTERRSSELANAAAFAYRERSNGGIFSYGWFPYWGIFANQPRFTGFTFIPRNGSIRFGSRVPFTRPPSRPIGPPRVSRPPARPQPQGSIHGRSGGSIGRSRGTGGGRSGGVGGIRGR